MRVPDGNGDGNGTGGSAADPPRPGARPASSGTSALVPVARRGLNINRGAAFAAETSEPSPVVTSPEQLDAFRELRTRLLAMGTGSGLERFTTLVIPVSSGSGASFVARNLAAAFALEEGSGAILVDCNLRHPTQSIAFALPPKAGGLFDYLDRGETAVTLSATKMPGLHLIPAGSPRPSLREYFSTERMREVMTALRATPCYVLLDGPPARGSPDARILSNWADFVVLVAGYGIDTCEGVAEAAGLFEPNKFAGVVFNER
jgi:Mrp family chromosome partitioning ATPase